MKIVYNCLRDVNGMKNHSNWFGFDVKILKEGFIRGWEKFKTSFPRKSSLKSWFWVFHDWASHEVQSQKFSWVASESQVSHEWVAKASRWTRN